MSYSSQRNVFHEVINILNQGRTVMPRNCALYHWWINHSQRFIIPDAGRLLRDKTKTTDDFLNLCSSTPPYDCYCILHEHEDRQGNIEHNLSFYCKWEYMQKHNDIAYKGPFDASIEFLPSGAVILGSMVYFRNLQTVFPFHPVLVPTGNFSGNRTKLVYDHSIVEETKLVAERMGINKEEFDRNFRISYGRSIYALFELAQMLDCSNVAVSKAAIPPAIIRKRRKKNLPSLYDYNVLVIDGESTAVGGDRTDKSDIVKRSHWRRGHIRRLDDHRRVWVRSAFIRGNAPGTIDKEYHLKTNKGHKS